MKKKRFGVEQIVGVLKQAEVGVPVVELIRKVGISEQTFYRWKAKYVGLEVDQVALPLLFLLSEHPYCARTGRPGLFTTVDCGSFSSFWRVVWLMSSSRVDSAMRGSSISFLTRASVAWLDSCLGSFLCILAQCHESKGITGQFGTGAGSFRIVFIPSSCEQSVPICEM
jgi:hypothetical protein